MNDIYKNILDEIAKPLVSLNESQIEGIINKLAQGSMYDRLAAASLKKLDNYINLSLQIAKDQKEKLIDFVGEELCDCGKPFPEEGLCEYCGAHSRYRGDLSDELGDD
ncbi:hypothetical protein KA005_71625 [bacterium]|nr:hypothetical protein [bacterium]